MSLISDIRVDVGDDGATQRLSDSQYIALFQKSARRLNRELSLAGSDAITVDASGDLTSPTDSEGRMYDLLLLQAECLLLKRDISYELNSGVGSLTVRDGEQSLDNTAGATLRQNLLDGGHSPCEELKQALINEKMLRMDGKLIW